MKILRKYSFAAVLFLYGIFQLFILINLNPIHYAPHNFFFLDLLGVVNYISRETLIIINLLNLILIWFIGKQILPKPYSIVPSLIYALSPWSSYLVTAGSFYIYLTFLVLVLLCGLILIHLNKIKIGTIVALGGIVAAIYSSLIMFFLLSVMLVFLPVFKIISFNKIKALIIFVFLLTLPLIFIIYTHKVGFMNIANSEIKVFNDPGLINMVNSYQSNARKEGMGNLAKLSENKYLFIGEKVLLKYISQFAPTVFFTQQEKLLGFSFSPPLFLGLFIPFVFGLNLIWKSLLLKKITILSSLLVLPSVLSRLPVDLNRLIVFSPFLVFIISYGLIEMFRQRKRKLISGFFIIAIILVVFQLMITILDINEREKERFSGYFYYEKNYEIDKQ